MMSRSPKIVPVLFALLVSGAAVGLAWSADAEDLATKIRPGAYVLSESDGTVSWTTTPPGVPAITGDFTDFEAKLHLNTARPALSSLVVEVSVGSIDTDDDDLDTHLRSADVLDVIRHPVMSFRSLKVVSTDSNNLRVFGELTVRGAVQPVELDVNMTPSLGGREGRASALAISGATVIDRTQSANYAETAALGRYVRLTMKGVFKPVGAMAPAEPQSRAVIGSVAHLEAAGRAEGSERAP